jgi:hypothetical protein
VIEPSDSGAPAPQRRGLRILGISVLLLLAFGWILRAGGLPLLPPAGMLARVESLPFVGFVLGLLFHMLARYGRCQLLVAPLAPMSFRKTMSINAIAMVLITFLPLRIGEFARPAMLREKGQLSAMAVTGTVGAERILDGLAYSLMLLVSLALTTPRHPLPDHIGSLPVPVSLVPQAARAVAATFAVAFVVMLAFYRYRETARAVTERVLGIVSKKLAARVAGMVERLSDGFRFLVNLRYSLPYVAITVAAIVAHVWAIKLLANSVGISELTYLEATVVLGVLSLGFAMPNAPGFFGTIQLALYAGLSTYVAPEKVSHEGSAFVFLFYVSYLAIILTLAFVALVVDLALPASQPGPDPARR